MLLRIFWLAYFVWPAFAGPVTKIEDRTNDLRAPEDDDFYDSDASRTPQIYEDLENLELIDGPPKSSYVSKRMAEPDRSEFRAFVSKRIAEEFPETNLSDAREVEKLVGAVFKLYGQYADSKMAKSVDEQFDNQMMLGDQPMNDDSGFKKIVVPTFDDVPTVRSKTVVNSERNMPSELTEEELLNRENKERRSKSRDMYLALFKTWVLTNIHRPNSSVPINSNFSIPIPVQAMFNGSDSPYMEKIRSFYPTCDIPKNTKDAWKEENLLNLFFNVDYHQNATIATATLRLHRLPRENLTNTYWNADICPDNSVLEEEKLLRVSIYWYVRSAKKHSKVKRRLCDSKMISDNSPWVELSVKAATKTWTKSGKNMGLAILVEDQDGGTLKASKYFKGATCTVGTVNTPTPRPIPTLITDTAKQINDTSGIRALLGLDQAGSIPGDFGLLPKIDVCVLELPGQLPLVQVTGGDCELKNTLNALSLNTFGSHHHIRHQKHLESENQQRNSHDHNSPPTTTTGASGGGSRYDFRSRIINKKVIVHKDMLEKFNNGSVNR